MKLASFFSDGVILQQGKPVAVWGEGEGEVAITVDGVTAKAQCADGKFLVSLPLHEAGGPYTLVAQCGGETVEVNDVYYGEVFIASGQSNMAFTLANLFQPLDECKQTVRMLTYERPWSESRNIAMDMRWLDVNEDNRAGISAAASHFAVELANTLNVPVGIVCNAQGASNIQTWMSPEAVEAERELFILSDAAGVEDDNFVFNARSYLYNNSLLKVAPYTARGALWYQGESNTEGPTTLEYDRLFSAFLKDWRKLWQDENMPMITVQIAPFDSDEPKAHWEHLQEKQLMAYLNEKNVGLVTTGDIGHRTEIHPIEKKVLGKRLARYALGMIYGHDILYRPPVCTGAELDGNTVVLSFCDAGEGLRETRHNDFAVLDKDGNIFEAEYSIEGDKVRVWADGVVPSEVRLGYCKYSELYLYSSADLPVSPFRISVK